MEKKSARVLAVYSRIDAQSIANRQRIPAGDAEARDLRLGAPSSVVMSSKSKGENEMKTVTDVVMNRNSNGGAPVKPEDGGHAINEDGVLLEDLIMSAVLGIKENPRVTMLSIATGTLLKCNTPGRSVMQAPRRAIFPLDSIRRVPGPPGLTAEVKAIRRLIASATPPVLPQVAGRGCIGRSVSCVLHS
jgi:hypothetical protein